MTLTRLAVPLLSAALLAATAGPALADADRLAVLTIGTPDGPDLTDAAAPVSILQVSSDRTGYGSFATVPGVTLTGTAKDEGHLTVAPDGSLLFAGYGATAGTPAVATTAATEVPRVVAAVSADGTSSIATRLGDAFTGGRVTSVATDDGRRLWLSGDGKQSGASIVTTTLGATSSTPVPNPLTAVSAVEPVPGLGLYAGPSFVGGTYPYDAHLYRIGTGLPASGTQTATQVATTNPNSDSSIPGQVAFLDLDGTPGVDTAYMSGAAGLYKRRYDPSTGQWTYAGETGLNGGAIAVVVSDGVARIYTVNGYGVTEQDDTTPNSNAFTYGQSQFIASPPPGMQFRGIAAMPPGSKPAPRISFGVSGLANAVGDPTNPPLPVTVSDPISPSGPFTLSEVALGDFGIDASMLAADAFTTAATDANHFQLTFQPHGVGNQTLYMTATAPDGRWVTDTVGYAASAATDATSRYLAGGSDASTGLDAGGGYMLVGDDEFNTIGLYPTDRSGLPLRSWDFTAVKDQDLWVGGNKMKERDIEASARAGDRAYWVGSNGNGKGGKAAPERNSLYATDITGSGAGTQLRYVGQYLGLQADLVAWDHGNAHGLGADHFGLAASVAKNVDPKAADGSGFSIEGLEFVHGSTSSAYGALRAPLEPKTSRHLALVVPVTNLDQLVLGNPQTAVHATFGAPLLWDLGGLGVREIRASGAGRYLIIAGSAGDAAKFALYAWDGDPTHAPVKGPDLPAGSEGSGWEGFASVPDTLSPSGSIRLIGDRGDAFIFGGTTAAKDLGAPAYRTSRTDVFSLAGLPLDQQSGTAGGSVPATLSLTLGAAASFGAFTPGLDHTYTASTTANVISTAGGAALAVSDPGHLTNGAFSLPEALQVSLTPSSWSAPVSNGAVAIAFSQHVGAADALRTGGYAATLTFTLSTTTP